jgi:opacity protein-like surface antigen
MKPDRRSIMARTGTALATLIAIGAPTLSAQAADDSWKFEITPYIWTSGVDGDVTVQGHTANIDVSFSDMMDVTDASFSFLGVAQYQRLVFWAQVDYLSQDTDELDDPPPNARVELDSTITTLAVGYQFDGWAKGQTYDVLVGWRQFALDKKLTVTGVGTLEKDTDINDIVLVVRPSIQLSDRWRFNPTLSYGSGDSESSYELQPQFQYQFSQNWAARLGYRILSYDIEYDANNKVDVSFSGFILGLGGTF